MRNVEEQLNKYNKRKGNKKIRKEVQSNNYFFYFFSSRLVQIISHSSVQDRDRDRVKCGKGDRDGLLDLLHYHYSFFFFYFLVSAIEKP